MNDKDRSALIDFSKKLESPYTLELNLSSEKGGEMKLFCDELSSLADKIKIVEKRSAEYSSIMIHENLEIMAVPKDRELPPFLDEILFLSEQEHTPPYNLAGTLSKIKDSVTIDLYIAAFCPTCPFTVRQMLPASKYSDKIKVRVIDTDLYSEMAQEKKIMSVPTVVVNDLSWTGEIKFSEILEFIAGITPSEMNSESIARMLKDGDASMVTKMMLEKNELFPSFLSLLKDEKWSTRLGAIVVMEEISEIKRELAAKSISFIMEEFNNNSHQVKGDLLYVAGLAGGKDILPDLNDMMEKTENEELKTAAKEAISEIELHFT